MSYQISQAFIVILLNIPARIEAAIFTQNEINQAGFPSGK